LFTSTKTISMNEARGILNAYKQAIKNVPILRYSWVFIATILILALAAYFKLNNSDVFFYAVGVILISFMGFLFSYLLKTKDNIIRILLYILISTIVISIGTAVLSFGSFIVWQKPDFYKRWFPNQISSTEAINYKPEYKFVRIIQKAISNLDKTKYTGTAYDYWPECGLRGSYYHLLSIVSFSEIQNLFDEKVFVDNSKSSSEVSLNERFDFRHYNPNFIKWLKVNINEALTDTTFIQNNKSLYEKYLSYSLRSYAITYLFLEKDEEFKNKLLKEYCEHIANKTLPTTYIQQTTFVERWKDSLITEDEAYRLLRSVKGSNQFDSLMPIVVGFDRLLHDPRHILARDESVRLKLQHLMKKGDANVIGPAIYFWIRRAIDGTDKELFSVLQIIMTKFDTADFHNLSLEVAY
jgi:hypothetical protein